MDNIIVKVNEKELNIIENNIHLKSIKNEYKNYKNMVCVKPWGYEFLSYETSEIAIWILTVNNGHKTSLHVHFNKDTTLIVLQGCAKLNLIDDELILHTMSTVNIPKNKFHSIESISDSVTIMEVEIFSQGITFSDKNDVLRIDDIYIREKTGYENSIQLSEDLNRYNYFYLHDTFENDVLKVVKNIEDVVKDNIYIIMNGTINMNGQYLKPGSLLGYQDCQQSFQSDDLVLLELKKTHYEDDSKIIYNLKHLEIILKKHKNVKKILTSGCFDIVHIGHMHNLKQAKLLGDKLFVCLSNDEQIKKLKGNSRPVNSYSDRIQLFKTIKYVDYIILYNEEDIINETTLDRIISIVSPFYWVKGSDYNKEDILKKHPSVKIKIIDNIPNISTSSIISSIEKN